MFRIYFNILSAPALAFHEIAHLIMILLLRSEYRGFALHITALDKSLIKSASVYNQESSPIRQILISLAPTLFWISSIGLSLFFNTYLITTYLIIFARDLNCSKGDWNTIRSIVNQTKDSDDKQKENSGFEERTLRLQLRRHVELVGSTLPNTIQVPASTARTVLVLNKRLHKHRLTSYKIKKHLKKRTRISKYM